MFTTEQREQARAFVEALARHDARVTSGALIGSLAADAGDAWDEWSDVDLTFGIANDVAPETVLADWTDAINRELGVLDHWDLRAGASVYRVLLLASGLEMDVSVTPQRDFTVRGGRAQVLFGQPRREPDTARSNPRELIGLGWHHIIHARSAIERGKPWQAEYWLSALRDHTLALACIRFGESPVYARGVDRLPASVTDPLEDTLARALDPHELRRALAAVTAAFLREVDAADAALGARLGPSLREYGGA
ncbi:MAG TPA: hypothetical protein VF808_05995 [Ktedonobacterales bacterium]